MGQIKMGKLKKMLVGLGISSLIVGATYFPRFLEELKDETQFRQDNYGKIAIRKKDTVGLKPINSKLITLNVSETEKKDMMIWQNKNDYVHIFKEANDNISLVFIHNQPYCNKCARKVSPSLEKQARDTWDKYWDKLDGDTLTEKLNARLSH